MTTTTPTPAAQLAEALDAYRAEQGAALELDAADRPTWAQLVQYLIDNPPWHSYKADSPAEKLRALWNDFPFATPFGEVLVTLQRTADQMRDRDFYGRSFGLTIPAGGSFIVNGKQYASEAGGYVTGSSINVSRDRSYDGREVWRVQHNAITAELTDAARAKLAAWIEEEGAALIFEPARVIARDLFDAVTGANRAREARDKAHALAIAADADWQFAARSARDAVADAAQLAVAAGGAA